MLELDAAPGRPARLRPLVLLALALLSTGAASRSRVDGRGGDPRSEAIAVIDGRADFDLAGNAPGSKTLVIVSALSREAGPFPITLKATPKRSSEIRPLPLTLDPPAGAPMATALPPYAPPPVTDRAAWPSRRFHLLVRDGDVASASNYLPVEARLAAVGRRVQVYVDERDGDAIDSSMVREVVATFDGQIHPLAARRFGQAEDTDGDGRFTIFVSSWLTRLAGGRIKVDGYVRGADFDPGLGAPFGNHCDMMYLSTALRPGPHLKTVLAHEYTHAVTFSRKAFPNGPGRRLGAEEEGWLDEGLSHLVEDVHGFSRSNLDYRVSAFLSRPERYRLVVEDYYAAELFRSHGSRGGTYLFLRWCVDRHGDEVLDRLIRSDLRGMANLEAATGRSFAALYREWTVALFLSGLDPASDAAEPTRYRSLDPRGTIEDWVLAGPRSVAIKPGDPADSWDASGTSSHYAVIEGAPEGAMRVEVAGPARAQLQVTIARLPGGLGALDLDVRPTAGRNGDVSIVAKVAARGGTRVRLGAIAWEPLIPGDDAHAPGFRRGGLDMLGIARRFGTSALGTDGRLASGSIRLDGVTPGDGPLIFKAVGTDDSGRRVTGWAEVAIPPGRFAE